MKTILTFFILTLFVNIGYSQVSAKAINPGPTIMSGSSGNLVEKKPEYVHVKDGIAISPQNQADIKALDEAMKPLEDYAREYNRLLGLKRSRYETIIKQKYSLESLVGDPIITADSIKMIIVFPRIK